MKYIYRIYQICIALPIILVLTVLTSVTVSLGCFIGNGHFWGYYPGKIWAAAILKVLLIPVKVTGRENLKKGESYVFVSNHQGSFDIFLIYGHLCRNFKWMMKRQLRKVPFVGIACEMSHQIFVDKSGPRKVKETYDKARHTLKDGMSVMVFPEGARTFTGHMGVFRRGAFMLADELQLPIVPLTINGSYDILPRYDKWFWVKWHPLTLTIHAPIYPKAQGADDIKERMEKSYDAIMSAITPEYQGYIENPDQ
ncbi:MAG: lysophospholipid acyltransferase family protein [Prevotellaceae bacterium]|nr:lysophospholipid acyltransferase family protein [Prevotellaceae bacterium]